MSTAATVGFVTLWLFLLGLAALVVVAFRQIERAQQSVVPSATALPVGADVPEIRVVTQRGIEPVPHGDDPYILAFVSTECGACDTVLRHWFDNGSPVRTVVVVTSPGRSEYTDREPPENVALWGIANPGDARLSFNVNVVPTIYAIAGGKVVGVVTEGRLDAILALAAHVSGNHSGTVNGNGSERLIVRQA